MPITLPSHTTLLTGRYPPTHTVRDNGTFVVPPSETTLAEVLGAAGYQTAAFVGSFPMTAKFGLNQGFATYDDTVREIADTGPGPIKSTIYFDERPANEVVDAALAYHRARPPGPFFTFLHFFDPHQPQTPPPPYDIEFRQTPYDGEIAFVDEQIARVVDLLKERGEWESTVVVVTADHGEGLGEHGELTHAILLHQATLHIPLVLSGPGVPRGRTSTWTCSTQVMATLLDLLGVAVPEVAPAPGTSLVPLMRRGGRHEGREAPFSAYFETIAPRTSQGWSQLTGFMEGDVRYVHAPRPELYDLAVDPRELEDIAGRRPADAERLRARIAAFLKEHETASVGAAVKDTDRETLERLAGLGYLQVDPASLTSFHDMLDTSGRIDPKDRVADISLFSQSKAALQAGKWNLALSLSEELLARNPRHAVACQSLAVLHAQAEDWPKALAYLDRAIEYGEGAVPLLVLRGSLLVEMGRAQEGLDVLLSLPEERRNLEVLTWLGRACTDVGRHKEALAWFEKGLLLQPSSKWLRLYTANALAAEGRGDEARERYLELLGENPYFPLGYYNFGTFLMEAGDLEGAARVLGRAAELDPSHDLTRESMVELGRHGAEEPGT